MEEEFLLNGKTYTSSQLNQYAKKSNLSLGEYIKESGAVRKKTTKAYTLNGKSYDEATIKEYARKSNLSIEEYIKEAGVKKKESSEPTAQERPSVSPTKPTQPSTSSATEQPTRAAASVSLGGPTDIIGVQPDITRGEYKDIFTGKIKKIPTKSIQEEKRIVADQAYDYAKKNIDKQKSLSRLEDELDAYQISDGIVDGLKGVYNSLIATPLNIVNEKLGGDKNYFTSKDYKPLEREKKQALKELKEEKGFDSKVSEQEIFDRAKQIFIKNDETEQLHQLIDSALPSGYDREGIWKELKLKELNSNALLKSKIASAEVFKSQLESYNEVASAIRSGKATTEEISKFEELKEKAKVAVDGLKYLEDNFDSFLKEANTDQEKLELFKYNYNDFEKTSKLLWTTTKNIFAGTTKLLADTSIYLNNNKGDYYNPVAKTLSEISSEVLKESEEEAAPFYRYKASNINNFSDLGSFATQLAAEQIPVLASIYLGGVTGTALVSTSSGGQKIFELEEEAKQPFGKVYSDGEKLAAGWLYSGAEFIPERIGTARILKDLEKTISSASSMSRKMFMDSFYKNTFKGIGKVAYATGLEGGTELITAESQINIDKELLDIVKTDAENNELRAESFFSGALMGGGMAMAGGSLGFAVAQSRLYSEKKDIKNVRDILSKIDKLSYEAENNRNLTDQERKGLYENINELNNKAFQIVERNADKGINLSIEEKSFLLDVNKKQGELRDKAKEISESNYSKEYKKEKIKELSDEFNSLEEKRNNTISGRYSRLFSLSEKELSDIKKEATDILVSELNQIPNREIVIPTSEQIEVKALEILNTKQNAAQETQSIQPEVANENEVNIDFIPIEDIGEKTIQTNSKIKRKDLFDGVGSFSRELGGSDVDAVPVSHSETGGIEFVQYANPNTGSVDVIVTGTSENDFVGFYRIYENGKPTNKWSSKFENQSRNKEAFKTMISGVQEMLPEGHEYTEKTSISTDGLRVWAQQLGKGYELQYDENGKIKTNLVAINGDAIVNDLGIPVNKGSFENIRVKSREEFEAVKKALLPYIQKLGLNEDSIKWMTGTVKIELPILVNKTKADVVPTELATESATPSTQSTTPTTVTYKGTEYSKNEAGNWVNNKTGNEVKGIGVKGKALIAELNNIASTEAVTQPQPAATEQVAKTEIEEALDDIVRPKTTNVVEQVDRAKKAISKILPGVEIVYHDTEESYSKATGEKTNGLYDPQTKKIHVNGPRANKRTVAHEVAHAVILRGLSTDKEAAMLTKRMFKALKGSLKNDSKRLKELEEFAKSYEKGVRNEEKISELLGYLASEYETLPQPTKNIIQKWLEKIAIMLKMKPFTDKEVVDFMNTLAERVREGQEITEQDVAILIKKIDNNESFENEYTPTNGTVEETSSKRRAQVDDTVIKESDIIDPKTLTGKPLEVVYYDNFTSSPYKLRNRVSGSILSKKGEGGPGYSYREEIRKKGIVAAFTNVTKGLNLIQGIRSRNEVAKENAIVGVALQNKETGHLGNKNTELDFYSPTEGVIAQAINDKLITEDQAVKMLKGAVDAYRQTKKGSNPKSSLGFTSNDFSTLDEFYKKINSISFERRGTFNSIVIPSKSNLKITKSTKPYVKTWLDSGIPTLNEYYDATSERYTKEAEPHDIVKYIDPSLGKLGIDSTVNITDAERKRAKLMGVDIVTIDDNLAHTSYPVVLFGRNIGVPSTFNSVRDIAKEWNVPNPFFKAGRRSDKATPVRIPEVKETKKTPNVSGRRQISPENSSNYANMTEDGKGNFVFYHYGPRAIKFIDPKKYGSNKGSITSKPEIAAMGRVGGMSQFYTTTEFSEANVVGDKYMIKVPMDKVYDFNTDPDNLIVKAKEMFKEKHPDLPFTANDQLAYITKLAEKAGYDMTVAEWNNRTRAQSTKPLKPVDVQTMDGNTIVKPFKEDYESNVSKGFTPVIPTSKEAMLKKVYDDINAERNRQNKYDDLYHLAEEFPKKTQEEITDMIEGSNISQELKDAYATVLAYEPGMRMSSRRQVNTGAIAENTKAEIDRVKKLPLDAEDGSTFNLDGTKYDKGGLIVPVTSLEPNTNQKDLSSEMVAKFTKDNESKIGDDSIVKVGIYKFPDKDTVSVDMSIVIPNKYRAVALEFGKMIGQESLYDLDANENVKTGADGMNPVNLTDEQFRVAAAALKEGQMPQITISRRQQTSAIDTAVAAAKSRGFDDKTIMNYLVSRGYTSEEATRAVLKYNKSVAERIREEEGVFTRAGRRRIAIALDKFRRITVSKRAFNTKTGLQLREFMDGNINAELREARIALEEYDKMLPKDKAQRAVIEAEADKFLKRDSTANLPLEFKAIVGRFRTHIDNLSMRLVDTGTITQAQADKLRSNIGKYVNRSYQIFDDPKWKDKVTEEMKEAVRNELRNLYYSMKGNVPKSKKDRKTYGDKFAYKVERALGKYGYDEDAVLNKMIEGEINDMIEPKKASGFIGQKNVASKDLSIMKQKNTAIPLSVRQLMGEYGNAGQNYAKTVQKLSVLVYESQYLKNMRELGLGVFFFEEDDPNRDRKEFNTPIASEGSKVMSPLNGLYTTPEMAEMFKEDTVGDIRYIEKYVGRGFGPAAMRVFKMYFKLLGFIKKRKTAYSIGGHSKNVLGNVELVLSNAYIDPNEYANAFKTLKNSKSGEFKKKIEEYIRLGILSSNIEISEIKKLLRSDDFDSFLERRLQRNMLRKATNWVDEKLTNLYQTEDDFFKILGYEIEMKRYEKAYPNKSREEIQKIVSNNIKNILPNYNRIGQIGALTRAVPLLTTFMSYQLESYRTTWNNIALAKQEMSSDNKVLRDIGRKRVISALSVQIAKHLIMHSLGTVVFSPILNMIAAAGADDDEEKEGITDYDKKVKYMNLMLPDYAKIENGENIVITREGNGEIRFINFSSSDPRKGISNTISAAIQGKDPVDGFVKGAEAIIKPFVSEDILKKAVSEMSNNETDSGAKIYEEADSDYEKSLKLTNFAWKILQSGTYTSGEKILKSDDPKNEIFGQLTGYKIHKIDVKKNLYFKIKELKKNEDSAMDKYRDAGRKFEDGKITKAERDRAHAQAQKFADETYNKMREYLKAASYFGAKDYEIDEEFEKNGISDYVIKTLWANEMPIID